MFLRFPNQLRPVCYYLSQSPMHGNVAVTLIHARFLTPVLTRILNIT